MPRPEWNTTLTDASKYRLPKSKQLERKLQAVSKHDCLAQSRLRRQARSAGSSPQADPLEATVPVHGSPTGPETHSPSPSSPEQEPSTPEQEHEQEREEWLTEQPLPEPQTQPQTTPTPTKGKRKPKAKAKAKVSSTRPSPQQQQREEQSRLQALDAAFADVAAQVGALTGDTAPVDHEASPFSAMLQLVSRLAAHASESQAELRQSESTRRALEGKVDSLSAQLAQLQDTCSGLAATVEDFQRSSASAAASAASAAAAAAAERDRREVAALERFGAGLLPGLATLPDDDSPDALPAMPAMPAMPDMPEVPQFEACDVAALMAKLRREMGDEEGAQDDVLRGSLQTREAEAEAEAAAERQRVHAEMTDEATGLAYGLRFPRAQHVPEPPNYARPERMQPFTDDPMGAAWSEIDDWHRPRSSAAGQVLGDSDADEDADGLLALDRDALLEAAEPPSTEAWTGGVTWAADVDSDEGPPTPRSAAPTMETARTGTSSATGDRTMARRNRMPSVQRRTQLTRNVLSRVSSELDAVDAANQAIKDAQAEESLMTSFQSRVSVS